MTANSSRRWNGWGDVKVIYPWPEAAGPYLLDLLGEGDATPDAALADVIAQAPPSRLPESLPALTDPEKRARHARGQSLPDWVALRHGRVQTFPDGVAYPASPEEVNQFIKLAIEHDCRLIPYGGGTSVVGHINPLPDDRPVITLNLSRLNRLLDLDEKSRLATFEAGVSGPEIERQLQAHGYTLGHFPQSFEYSTLGGWIATRSSGQQSYYYGRIEELFAGGQVETAAGPLILPPLPASAAGPDLRHLILGSEGRLGIISQAIVRIRPLPESEHFYAAILPDWPSGIAAVRQAAQADVPLSMMRLSDDQESQTTFILANRERLTGWLERGLSLLGYGPERCLLLYGVTGTRENSELAQHSANQIIRQNSGRPLGRLIGNIWRKGRFRAPYLRNTLWEKGYAIDTLETALPWSQVETAAAAVKSAIEAAMAGENEAVLVLTHLSHIYRDGASIYITYLYRRAADPDQTLERWQKMKEAASQAIVAYGGTISHQHGVGRDHAPYLAAEKGERGLELLSAARQNVDPHGILNPGKLLAE